MRSYLCGDEFNSVLAEEDSASVKSYEATISPPFVETEPDIDSNGEKESLLEKQKNSMSRLFHEDDAAIVIQSALRRFLVRPQYQILGYNPLAQKVYLGPVFSRQQCQLG